MKLVLSFLVGLLFLFSCKKGDTSQSNSTSQIQPVYKNYLQTSYELQKSNVTADLIALRNKNGASSNYFIMAVAYLDVNGDGQDDIFMCDPSVTQSGRAKGQLFIYKNGDYIFDSSYFPTPPTLIAPRKAIIGDYNKDGMPDIFITGHGDDLPPFPGEYPELLMSNSSKKYDLVKFTNKIGFYHGACSGDIDNDGDLDIFVLGKTNSYFLINDGKGNFTYSTSTIDTNYLDQEYTCELVDIDKDGYLDLIMGGHEFGVIDSTTFTNLNGIDGSTRIYWGNSSFKYDIKNMINIPIVSNWGVITDLDVYDLDGDGKNEILVTRSGGRKNDFTTYFYDGWNLQVVQLNNRIAVDASNIFIENNIYIPIIPNNQEWIPWMRFVDFDNNGKIDFFSTKCTTLPFLRWELRNNKLIRVN